MGCGGGRSSVATRTRTLRHLINVYTRPSWTSHSWMPISLKARRGLAIMTPKQIRKRDEWESLGDGNAFTYSSLHSTGFQTDY